MTKISAGLLMFRRRGGALEVLLVRSRGIFSDRKGEKKLNEVQIAFLDRLIEALGIA